MLTRESLSLRKYPPLFRCDLLSNVRINYPFLGRAELIKLHSKVAYHRDQCDSDGALQVQAMLVQRVGIKESPEGTPPDAVLRGPFRRSESIGLQSARKPKQVNSIGGETDVDSVDTKQNENGSDEGEDKDDTENRDEDLLPLSIPFTGAWFEDDQFNTEYKPKGSQKLRGLRFHQWENMAGSKFYQLQAEAKDVDPGSYFVSFLCCKHSWDTSPSVNEPSAIQVSTSVTTPDFVGALPYTATRRVPLASYLKTNEWGHIVGGVVAVPIGAAGTVRATLHAEEQGWWRSGLITHSMVLTKLSDGQAQPILQPKILKSEPTFNTNAFLPSTSKAKDVSSRGDDNRVEDDDDVSRISNTSASPNSSTTILGGTPMPSKLFESTMSPVVGAEGGVVTRVDSQSKLEILELQRQVWRSQEETRHTREKLDVALASMNDVTSERRARESKAREERLIEVRALRDEIDRLQNEVEESRDLEKRYSSIEAQLRKSESEARRQGDRAFKALKEDQILRSNLEDARRDAAESRVVADNLTMKNNELRSNLDSTKAQHNELKLVADADRSRLEGIIADTEVLLKEKEELLVESKEEEQKKANLHQDAEKRLIDTENQLLKQQKMLLAAQHQLKIFESGQVASSPVGKFSGGGGSGTRSLDDASAKQMDGLLSFLTTMTTDRGFDSILFEVAEKGASILSAAHIIVFKVDRQGRSMFAWGGDEDFTVPYRGAKGGLAAKCASECQPMRVDDVASDSRAVAHEKEFEPRDNEDDEAVPTKSIMCTPVTYFDEDEEESAAAVIEYYNKLDQNGKAIPFTLRDEIIAGKIATVLGSCIKSDDLAMDVIMEEDEEDEEDDDEPEKEKSPEQLKRDLTKANLKIAELERKIENLEKNGVVGTKKVQKSGPPSRAARKKKGQAIIQRSVSIETGKLVEIKRYEKDDLAQNLILNTLKKNPIYCKFENCTPNELDQVVGAFEPLDVPKGVNLISQGERGDYFYIIESGTFKILINLPDGTQKQVAIFKPGQGVGELALIQDAPRAATVKAACVARVWRLKRENCDIVTFLRKKRNERCIKYMGSIKIPAAARASILGTESNTAATDCTLKDLLSESEIDGLVAQLTEEVFEPGMCIMQQGQRGDELFIIEEGVVDILIANAEELKTGQLGKKVAEIKDGTVFGEKALLGGDKRNASCVAQTRIKAFRLAREDFEKAIGSLAELLGKQGGPGEAVASSPGTAIRYEEIPVRELQNIQITKDLTIVSYFLMLQKFSIS